MSSSVKRFGKQHELDFNSENSTTEKRQETTMDSCKILLAAICVVVTLNTVARSAPLNSPPNKIDILISLGLSPKLTNATEEMKSVYPFIASPNLQNTMISFGPVVTPTCSSSLTLKDKLSVPYMILSYFISPLYMAYSYEEIQGPQHIRLAQLLDDTSFYLNSTFSTLRHKIRQNNFPVPTSYNASEAVLDHETRGYLQGLVNDKVVTLVITDDVVKVYRNYIILYSLRDALSQVYDCVTSI